jgi:hypothetical protein
MTTLYWLRYLFLLLLCAGALWMVWLATADARTSRRSR